MRDGKEQHKGVDLSLETAWVGVWAKTGVGFPKKEPPAAASVTSGPTRESDCMGRNRGWKKISILFHTKCKNIDVLS